jgi:Putative auto-transporter adhesin, head GIN domain
MRTLLLVFTIAFATLGAGNSALAADAVRETRVATGFSRIEIDGQADVILHQGTSEGVTVEASAQALRKIDLGVHDRTLSITLNDQRHWWDWILGTGATRSPRITINFTNVEHIEAAGSVRFTATNLKTEDLRLEFAGASTLRIDDLQASRLRLDGAGAIKAELAGNVAAQFIDLSGVSSYQAGGLVSQTAVLQVSGAGKALINASKALKVEISGAGMVQYVGNPTIEQEISGVGKITRRDAQ